MKKQLTKLALSSMLFISIITTNSFASVKAKTITQPVTNLVGMTLDFDTTTCYVNTNVNVRVNPDVKSESITILKVGEKVETINALENGWSNILYDGKVRYIKSEYLTIPYDFESNFKKDDLKLLYGIVNAEIGNKGILEPTLNVASVIFNRVESDLFSNNIREVLTEKSQFSSYWNGAWKKGEITEETKLACMLAYNHKSTKALYFDCCKGDSWSNRKRKFAFNDGYHDFFY